MADNLTLPTSDNGGGTIVLREISHSGDTAQLPGSFVMGISGSEGAYTAAAINGDATYGLDVDVTRIGGSVTVINAGTFAVQAAQSGTWTVTGTGGTFPVTDSGGSLTVDDGGSSITVDGTVAVSGSVAVTGPLTDAELRATAVPVSGTVTATIAAGATTIAKAEDDAYASFDVGVPAMAVQKSAPANTSEDGDYEFLQVYNGRLWSRAIIQDSDGASISGSTLGGSRALMVQLLDGSGNQITSFGAGTQYTEGDTDATITGTAAMMEVAANTLQPIQGTVADGVLVNLGSNNDVTVTGTVTANIGTVGTLATAANQSTIIGHVDGIEGLLTTIDADTGTLAVVGGGTEATALRVTIASDSTGVLSIDDNGASITVDGTVAATQSGTWTVQPGNTANTTAWLVTGTGGTFPVTDSGGSLTVDDGGSSLTVDGTLTVQGVDSEDAAVTANPILIGGRYDSTKRSLESGDVGAIALDPDGAVYVVADAEVSTGNTTTTPLGGSATFTGTGEQNQYSDVMVSCFTDQDGTLYFDFSVDGTNWNTFPTAGFVVSASVHELHVATKGPRYFRCRLVNGATPQGTLRLYTYYGGFNRLNAPLNQSIANDADATTTRSIIAAQNADGTYQNVESDSLGSLYVNPEVGIVLDGFNATTGWSALDTDTANLATTTKHVTGTLALSFDKANTAANSTLAGIQKTITSVDLGQVSAHDTLQTTAHLSSIADVAYVWLRIGTSSSHYNEWRIADSELTAGVWEPLSFAVGSASYAGTTGDGWDPSAITYIAVGVAFDAETNTLASIVFDEISYHTGLHTSTSLTAQISSSVSSPNVRIAGYTGVTPTGGGVESGSLRVTIASDSTGVLSIDDNGSSLTVDNGGTFAVQAAQSGTWTVGLSAAQTLATVTTVSTVTNLSQMNGQAIAMGTGARTAGTQRVTIATDDVVPASQSGTWNITNISGTVSLPTGAATAAKQPALGTAGTASADVITVQGVASMTPLQIADNGGSLTVDGTVSATQSGTWTVQPGNTANTTAWLVTGTGGTFPVTDSGGSLTVDNAGTFAVQVDGTALTRLTDIETNTDSGAVVGNGAAATAQRVTLANDSTGIVALTTSTASIGKLAANSGVTIGAVEIAAAQTLSTVTTVSTVTTCSTVTTLTGGGVAHDSADSGNPVKVGARAAATLSDDTMVANADRTDLVGDIDGALITRPNFPLGDILSDATSNTDGASTASGVFTATASTRSCITGFQVFRTDAGTTPIYVDFRDGTAGSVLWRAVIPPSGGANSPAYCGPCLFRTSANTALAYDVSAATSTVYINVSGYKSKV